MSDDTSLKEVIAYMHLLVKAAGGRVEMAYDFVEDGIPENAGLSVEFDDDREVVTFEIREAANAGE